MEGSFSGNYLQLVRFINTLERSKMFFEVDGVDLAGESTGPVKLQITMHSYLRSGAWVKLGIENQKEVIALAVLGPIPLVVFGYGFLPAPPATAPRPALTDSA